MKWYKTAIFLIGLAVFQLSTLLAQNQNVPLNHQFHHQFEREEVKSDEIIHSSFKPLLQRKAQKVGKSDSLLFPNLSPIKKQGRSWIARKLFHEHLIYLDSGSVQLSIDPLINVEFGDDIRDEGLAERSYYKNMRGFVARLNLGDNVSVGSTFRENQAVLPSFLDQRTRLSGVAYGQGRTKNFSDYGFDFAMASAYVSYSPSDKINLQAGHGKHFVGEGYRSLLLSDMAFNYPYLRVQSDWLNGKLNYQNVFALFQDLNRLENHSLNEGLFERKQAAFHFLSFSPDSRFSIGLFEGFIYPSLDSSGNIDVPLNYWAPLIGLNTLLKGDERSGNSNLGVNAKAHIFQRLKLYSQWSFFDEQLSQLAYQFGGKLFLGEGVTLQLEYNRGAKQSQNSIYHHYNESLTHPYQSDYEEFLGGVYFHKNRWMSRVLINNISVQNISINFFDFRQSYIVNPAYNLTFNFGVQYREQTLHDFNDSGFSPLRRICNPAECFSNNESLYLYFSLSTNLQNLYFNY